MARTLFRSIVDYFKRESALKSIPDRYIGTDDFGNKYYERSGDPSKGIKIQRRVEPPFEDNYRVPEVPAEWMSE